MLIDDVHLLKLVVLNDEDLINLSLCLSLVNDE